MKSVVFTLYLSVLQMIREIYCILSMFLVVGKISNKKSKYPPRLLNYVKYTSFMQWLMSDICVAFVLALHIYSKMFENTRFLLTFGEKCLYLRVYKIEPI